MDVLSSFTNLHYVSLGEAMLRLAAACILGLAIGLERQIKNKPLDFRPFMMVCLGAAMFTIIGMELLYTLKNTYNNDNNTLSIDPSRIMQGIIGGIGFLGAGAIFRDSEHVVGATTGAGIWMVGGIGMACALGLFSFAIAATFLALFIYTFMGIALQYFPNSNEDETYIFSNGYKEKHKKDNHEGTE
ncbi:MAG: MgtC/SapB family protein [Alphaproteobacteria bacterium]|nr:MgtC/SapB family protein [Alphaproteobacteria bacterium]